MQNIQSTSSLAGRMLLPNAERAKYLRTLIKVLTYILIFRGFLYLFLVVKGVGATINDRGFLMIQAVDSLILILPSTLVIVLFLMWLSRAYHNLHRAALPHIRFSPGWAVGAWFVPFMNFVRPYYIVKETWIRTQTAFREREVIPDGYSTIRYWWVIYIVPGLLLGFFSAVISSVNPDSVFEMTLINNLLTSIFQVIALFLLGSVVRSISSMEAEFAHRFLVAQAQEVHQAAAQYRIENSLSVPQPESLPPLEQEPERASKILEGEIVETKAIAKTILVCLVFLLLGTLPYAISDLLVMSATDHAHSMQAETGFAGMTMRIVCLFTVPLLVVMFIWWLNRCYNNLRSLRISDLALPAGIQNFWWLIPGANFFFAWTMLRDIKKHSQIALTLVEEEPDPLPLIDWSWFAFILGAFFFWLVQKLTEENGYVGSDSGLAMTLNVCAYLLFLFGLISSIIVTRRIDKFQADLFARVEAAVDKDTSVEYLKTIQ